MADKIVVISHGRQPPGAGAGLIRRSLPSPRFSTSYRAHTRRELSVVPGE